MYGQVTVSAALHSAWKEALNQVNHINTKLMFRYGMLHSTVLTPYCGLLDAKQPLIPCNTLSLHTRPLGPKAVTTNKRSLHARHM